MGSLKYKIWYDLWHNKSRTIQIILIIAIGAAAIGMIISTRNLVIPNMQRAWQATNPAMINLQVDPPLSEDELLALKRVDDIADVEGSDSTTIEWRLSPEDEWQSAGLIARADYNDQTFNKLTLVEGNWPTDRGVAIERGNPEVFGLPEQGPVYVRINDKEHLVEVGGLVYNQLVAPAYFGGTAQFYTTQERYEELVDEIGFNQIMATASVPFDQEVVGDIADRLQDQLEKQDKDSFSNGPGRVADPNKHFFQDFLDGLFYLLGVMGLLALILGLLLVYNTINTIISQQVDQIGIMKAIGAGTGQIFRFFLTIVAVYGVLALVLAIPLGVLGGWAIASWLVGSFNGDAGAFAVSWPAIGVQVLIALLAPLLASVIPILLGARITVREAISTYGLSTHQGLMDRLVVKIQNVSRLLLLTIANTFRNKWRVILMQVTLVLSGLIFMMVLTVRDSVQYTFGDVLFSILNYDLNFILEDPERIGRVEELTLAHPAVSAVEMWGFEGGTIRPANRPESEDDEGGTLFGVPLPTQLYGYQLRAGRWLEPSDTYAVVLNEELAGDVGVGVGDWVTFKLSNDRETTWQVVGLIFDPVITNSAHVPREVLLRETGSVNKASSIWIQTVSADPAQEPVVAKALRQYYEDHQIEVSPQRGVFGISDGATETAQTIINQFNFIIILLGIMAVIIGAVGSIALSGALSLSVLERRREIGVMRAIGASSGAIIRLFVGEGLLLGWLSWLIALPLSLPAGRLMLQAMSSAFDLDLVYRYTPTGAIAWLVIITLLAVVASWFPARHASRISVRESLAYA
jgi:putative ABC transport system permease protein